jgi:hypothetical protein
MFAHGLSVHQKCSSYALINLLFGLCKSVRIIELLVNLLSPHPGAPAHPSTPEVQQAKERTPTPSPSVIFTFGLVMNPSRSLGVRQKGYLAGQVEDQIFLKHCCYIYHYLPIFVCTHLHTDFD